MATSTWSTFFTVDHLIFFIRNNRFLLLDIAASFVANILSGFVALGMIKKNKV